MKAQSMPKSGIASNLARKTISLCWLALAAVVLTSVGMSHAVAQDQSSPVTNNSRRALVPATLHGELCPIPRNQTIDASGYSVLASDMPKGWKPNNGLNGTSSDTYYAHTFYWNPSGACCQATRAVLTVTFTALQRGRSSTSKDAGNDDFFFYGPGGVIIPVPGTGPIWTARWPFNVGATVTRTVTITNPAILNSGRLSLSVEDDTAITSATLQVSECCVNARGDNAKVVLMPSGMAPHSKRSHH